MQKDEFITLTDKGRRFSAPIVREWSLIHDSDSTNHQLLPTRKQMSEIDVVLELALWCSPRMRMVPMLRCLLRLYAAAGAPRMAG